MLLLTALFCSKHQGRLVLVGLGQGEDKLFGVFNLLAWHLDSTIISALLSGPDALYLIAPHWIVPVGCEDPNSEIGILIEL